MSEVKYLSTKDILTCGSKPSRIVLDYDLGIAYNYHAPERITAVYERGAWHITDVPYYSTGGWGSGSSGDGQGYYEYHNTQSLLNTIGAKILVWNKPIDLSPDEYLKREQAIARALNLQLKAKRLNISMSLEDSELTPLKIVKTTKGKNKGTNPRTFINKMSKAVSVFIERKPGCVELDGYIVTKDLVTLNGTTVAFYDTSGVLYMNAQLLNTTNLERRLLGGQSLIQSAIRKVAKYSIPFNVLDSAGLALSETKIIDQGPEESFTIIENALGYGNKSETTRHFTGALLLENAGRKFLLDVDRREIEHKIFNAFFVEVSAKASTIKEAYDSMVPDEVKESQTKGVKVLRQGEFFFIDTGETIDVDINRVCSGVRPEHPIAKEPHVNRARISLGKGRPNDLFKPVNMGYADDIVCGIVTHSGREHWPLNLGVQKQLVNPSGSIPDAFKSVDELKTVNAWYNDDLPLTGRHYKFKLFKVVPNTTLGNFTIEGDID